MDNIIRDIIKKLQGVNAQIFVDGESLRIDSKRGVIDNQLQLLIKAHKGNLIKYVKKIRKDNFGIIFNTPVQSHYSLSSSQRRLWVLSQFEKSNVAYNMSGVYVFEGNLNKEVIEESFNTLIERHEILRTVFKEDENEEVKQFIKAKEEFAFKIGYKDLRKEIEKDQQVRKLVQNEITRPFNLAEGPLVRAGLYQVENTKWVFSYVMHHIISDGWSMGILIKELLLLYNAYIKGENNPLLALHIQYKDYAVWQQEQLSGEKLKPHEEYWLKQFERELPVLELPTDKVRPLIKTYNGDIVHKHLESKLSNGIKHISQEQGGTLFMGLLAAVNVLLYKYTNQEDIIIGSPIAGREHIELEDQIGVYLNTLVLRSQFKGENSFKELFDTIKQVTLGAYEHQIYPFDELVDKLHIHRDTSRNAMFDVMVVLKNAEIGIVAEQNLQDIKISGYGSEQHVVSKFDLTFGFTEQGDGLYLGIEYNNDIYNKESIERLSHHLEELLSSIISEPTKSIQHLEYLTKLEKQQLLEEFNNTATTYPKEKTLVDLFEEQVEKTPDNVALVFGDKELTYRELNEKSNQLASYLRKEYKIKSDDLIGIKLERNEWMIICMLGILKSGMAYVPIDPSYPKGRIAYILEDSSCKVLIDEKELEKFKEEQKKYAKKNPLSINKSSDLAYVIYTSGSTGKPKGVMIEHSNVSAFIHWCKNEFNNSNFDTVFAVTSICFDLSIFEIFYTLSIGKKVRILDNGLSIPAYLKPSEHILLNIVPSVVGTLLSEKVDLSSVKVLNMAGEPIPRNYIDYFDCELTEIRNLYGPSEDTTYSTIYRIKKNSAILIGSPIYNTQIYIVDGEYKLLPIGVVGEICIAGEGLARGYLNKPELTKEKFVENPFKKGGRMYKTGDLGKWMPDGNIEFIGRKDNQVKIRGYRIELGEIESAIQSHEKIGSCVVIARANKAGEKELIAYVVNKEELNASELRGYLKNTIPDYMMPSNYVQLEKLPLTPNGKVDKKALPDPEGLGMETGSEYIAPRNEVEDMLVEIWSKILGISKERIGIKDNFFDLGGNSIKIIKMVGVVNKVFNGKLSIANVFGLPNIQILSEFLSSDNKNTIEDLNEDIKVSIDVMEETFNLLNHNENGK